MIRQRLHIPVTPIELAVAASTPATEVPWPLSSAGVASSLTKSRPGTRRTARSGCLSWTPVSTTATIVVRTPRSRSQAFWARTWRCSHWLVHSGSGGIQSTATTPSLSTLTTSASRAHRPRALATAAAGTSTTRTFSWSMRATSFPPGTFERRSAWE